MLNTYQMAIRCSYRFIHVCCLVTSHKIHVVAARSLHSIRACSAHALQASRCNYYMQTAYMHTCSVLYQSLPSSSILVVILIEEMNTYQSSSSEDEQEDTQQTHVRMYSFRVTTQLEF